MADRHRVPAGNAGAIGNGGHSFPPEALEHHDEVKPADIKKLREKVGVDFESDEWEVIDGFGTIANA